MKCLFWYWGSFIGVVKMVKFNIFYFKFIFKYNFIFNMYDKKFDFFLLYVLLLEFRFVFFYFFVVMVYDICCRRWIVNWGIVENNVIIYLYCVISRIGNKWCVYWFVV